MADKERYLEAAATLSRTFGRGPEGGESWAIHKILDGGDPLEVRAAHRILAGDVPPPPRIVEKRSCKISCAECTTPYWSC